MDDDDDGILLDGSDCGDPAVGTDGRVIAATGYLVTGPMLGRPYTDADGVYHDPIVEAEFAFRHGLPGRMGLPYVIEFDEKVFNADD